MAYVVTQSCCADASCVVACPVNCIHPAPGEPGFAEAEMLYVDANSCVGCGACITACPVDAILPETVLTESAAAVHRAQRRVLRRLPAHRPASPLAVVAKQRRLTRPGPFRVAVVGAGPAGLYTADELLKHPELQVDVYDRLPTPYGLVRAGVAPDHQSTKQVTQLFRAIEDQPGFRYFLGVEIGRGPEPRGADRAVPRGRLLRRRRVRPQSSGSRARQLPGSCSSTDLVGWYNGHPDKQDLVVPLEHRASGRGRQRQRGARRGADPHRRPGALWPRPTSPRFR